MGATRSSTAVVAPESVFIRLAIVCGAATIPISIIALPRSPLLGTLIALALMALIAMVLTRMPDDTWARSAAVVSLAVLGTQLGYFYGPNSAFAAVLAILLAITGLLSARQAGRRSMTGWLVLIVICAGQLAIVVLASYGHIADRSLAPVLRQQAPWQNVTAHLAVQAVYVVAFLAGRAAQKRYRQLLLDALDASRDVAIREALLEEARADYERARALTEVADATTAEPSTDSVKRPVLRAAIETPPSATELVTGPTDPIAPSPPQRLSVTVIDDGTHGRWSKALQSKLRVQDVFVLGACLAGVYFTASLVKAPTPRIISLVAIIAIAAMVALRALLFYRRPDSVVAWPYPIIAFLSAGPAYGFGLHAGFASIVATVLFTSRLFRARRPDEPRAPNVYSIYAVCISHGVTFALVMLGALPDESVLPLHLPGFTWYGPYLHQAMVMFVYIVAYLAGGRVDREFARAYDISRDAYAAAMRTSTQLQIARTELDAALKTEGLFTGTAVGSYQLGRLLGRGGMGEVYEAERAGGRVALKLLRADRLGDPVALERFAHEANLLTRVASPYCARVIEVSSDRTVPFLAMEYVDGPSLSAVLRERGRLDTTDLIALVDDLARGLGDVHAADVVHLDLKPSNVLRDSSRGARWKIVDFGIARMLTGEAHRKVAGTPPYMAPEQALGEPLDTRTDLYSLSLILYRAITGRPAFTGTDAAVIANRARTIGPPDPREVVTIPEELALALRVGLAANIADRFTDAGELRTAIIGALGGRLDERLALRARDLLARAPWASVALISGPRSIDVVSRRST